MKVDAIRCPGCKRGGACLSARCCRDAKEWCSRPGHHNVGRQGVVFVEGPAGKERFPKRASPFANPYKVGQVHEGRVLDLPAALALYERHVLALLGSSPELEGELMSMAGGVLGCWCAPNDCHARLLANMINRRLGAPEVGLCHDTR